MLNLNLCVRWVKKVYQSIRQKRIRRNQANQYLKDVKRPAYDPSKVRMRSQVPVTEAQATYERRILIERQKKASYLIIAPQDFSLITNTEGMTFFCSQLNAALERGQQTWVDMSKITSLHCSACIVLSSFAVRFHESGIRFNGTLPSIRAIALQFIESGYYALESFHGEPENAPLELKPTLNKIYVAKKKSADPQSIVRIIHQATQIIWGEERRCQGVKTILGELTDNTIYHASGVPHEKAEWLLAITKLDEKRGVAFTFIDHGVGILDSLRGKSTSTHYKDTSSSKQKWKNLPSLFKSIMKGSDSNAVLMEKLIDGTVHATCTGEDYRGNGLPGIACTIVDRNAASNLFIVSNDVRADVCNNQYDLLKSKFSGTFVYFELTEDNLSLPKSVTNEPVEVTQLG